jgi:hypothetical protein
MRLSIKALVTTFGVVWGGCLLLVGAFHLVAASYGVAFLDGVSSVYPGFHAARTVTDVLVGAIYGFVDGAIAGLVFGGVYNAFAESGQRTASR